jgi:hypothetical protein
MNGSARYDATESADDSGRVVRLSPRAGGEPLGTERALALLASEQGFRDWLRECLDRAPFEAFFWETPPYTRSTLGRDWEFVLVDAPSLRGVPPEPDAFAEHYRPGLRAVAFPNLGGDAWLVAPCPGPGSAHGAHLAAFTRHADAETQDAFWRLVGETALARIGERPVWLSTCGTGVYWLHARLDTRPKYYSHGPYRRWPP